MTRPTQRPTAERVAEVREACAETCISMIVGWRAWNDAQAAAAEVLHEAATRREEPSK